MNDCRERSEMADEAAPAQNASADGEAAAAAEESSKSPKGKSAATLADMFKLHASKVRSNSFRQGIAPGGGETICAPADGTSIQNSRLIYVRPRTGPQSAHLWWPAVAKLQAASVPIA